MGCMAVTRRRPAGEWSPVAATFFVGAFAASSNVKSMFARRADELRQQTETPRFGAFPFQAFDLDLGRCLAI